MTSNSVDEPNVPPSFSDHSCYLLDNWIPFRDLRISVDDIGFRQGVIAVERLRSYRGKLFCVDQHLIRWRHTTDALGIDGLPNQRQTVNLLSELLERNESLVRAQQEVGVTIFSTPGCTGTEQPTFAAHLNKIDHQAVQRSRETGQPLIVTDIQQPSERCWPRTIKVRSRVHFFLADSVARKRNDNAVGVLVDCDGNLTETSIANFAIVRSGRIVSPPQASVLGGITQGVIESLAAELEIAWKKQPVTRDEIRRAGEVLLMGTDGGIWFANSVDGQSIGDGQPGQVYQRLQDRFDRITYGNR